VTKVRQTQAPMIHFGPRCSWPQSKKLRDMQLALNSELLRQLHKEK
jgi:hypothetical protein